MIVTHFASLPTVCVHICQYFKFNLFTVMLVEITLGPSLTCFKVIKQLIDLYTPPLESSKCGLFMLCHSSFFIKLFEDGIYQKRAINLDDTEKAVIYTQKEQDYFISALSKSKN